jgi:uncharacterized protein YgbK (DUF1537 family)
MADSAPMTLGLVADDLTGACDASVQFAKRGCKTLLVLKQSPGSPESRSPRSPESPTVLVVTTDSRALSNPVAEAMTCEAVLRLMDAGADRIFLKIDSTMRGSISGQIAGALAAWQTRHANARAVVCPAYPRMGRTIQGNRLLVNGEPVDRTAIGQDPVSPVRTSDMGVLISKSEAISTVDATTDDDLMKVAETISDAGPAVIPVGSGGLAEALSATWLGHSHRERSLPFPDGISGRTDAVGPDKTPRILLLVTSLNPVSHAQVGKLALRNPSVQVVQETEQLREDRPIVVLVAPVERRAVGSVAESLAAKFAQFVERGQWDLLGLIGGDGARAALGRLGASGIRIFDSLLEGIPLGVVVGGTADGLAVFTKAGGFGHEDALVRIVDGVARMHAARGSREGNRGM